LDARRCPFEATSQDKAEMARGCSELLLPKRVDQPANKDITRKLIRAKIIAERGLRCSAAWNAAQPLLRLA
jgi:hypothetical protein